MKLNLEPFFYDSGWPTHRWICYFYAAFLFTYLLWFIWIKVSHWRAVNTVFSVLGKSSYEIYLVQMAVFTLFGRRMLSFIHNEYVQYAMWFVVAVLTSIFGGIILHQIIYKRNKVV